MTHHRKRLLWWLNTMLTTPTKYSDILCGCFSSVWCVTPLLLLGQLKLFFNKLTMKYTPEIGVGMSDWCLSEQLLAGWWCLVAFMKATNLLHRAMRTVWYWRTAIAIKWSAKWTHFAPSFCLLSPWRPPGRYGVSSCPMAASSGFWWSPGHAALGDDLLKGRGRGSSPIFLPDSKISGGSIGVVKQKKGVSIKKTELQPESTRIPSLSPSPKLGTNCPKVKTPPPLTRYHQMKCSCQRITYPLGNTLTWAFFVNFFFAAKLLSPPKKYASAMMIITSFMPQCIN